MSTIHFKETTTATPEQFIAGLTDFGPGRSKLFGNSTDEYLKVHNKGAHHADVTEGSNGIWERLRYDWSNPNHVVLTTIDSNLWGGASGHTYTFTRRPDGTTDIDAVVVREGKNLKGRLHYDWSNPNHVVLTTIDSNLWGEASGHTYTFTRRPDGTTDIDAVVVREGKNLKGRLHYDWSNPNHVVLTTIDSNLWGEASGH